ncbi:MAG: hypothetical protein ACOYO1_02380 [Bacteroidales bacterium]
MRILEVLKIATLHYQFIESTRCSDNSIYDADFIEFLREKSVVFDEEDSDNLFIGKSIKNGELIIGFFLKRKLLGKFANTTSYLSDSIIVDILENTEYYIFDAKTNKDCEVIPSSLKHYKLYKGNNSNI